MVDTFDEMDQAQNEVVFRRLVTWQMRKNAEDIQHLADTMPGKPPWYLPILLTIGLTVLGGYIGLVHQIALSNRSRIEMIADEQNRRSALKADMEDVKKRLAANEALAQRIPFINEQLTSMNAKLDRLIERRP